MTTSRHLEMCGCLVMKAPYICLVAAMIFCWSVRGPHLISQELTLSWLERHMLKIGDSLLAGSSRTSQRTLSYTWISHFSSSSMFWLMRKYTSFFYFASFPRESRTQSRPADNWYKALRTKGNYTWPYDSGMTGKRWLLVSWNTLSLLFGVNQGKCRFDGLSSYFWGRCQPI